MSIDPARINTLDDWLGARSYKNVVRDASTGDYLVHSLVPGGPTKTIPHLPKGSDFIPMLNSATLAPEARVAALAKRDQTGIHRSIQLGEFQETAWDVEQRLLTTTAAWKAAQAHATAPGVPEGDRVTAKSVMAERAREVGALSRQLNELKYLLSMRRYPVRQVVESVVERRIVHWASHDERIMDLAQLVERRDTLDERAVLL